MFLPAVEVLEGRGQRLHHQFIARIEMFVETTDSNTGLLHHIGNANAFETEFAKPLGRNAHDPSVCLCLITLRITHLPSPFLPESARIAPIVTLNKVGTLRASRVLSYSTLPRCKTASPRCRQSRHQMINSTETLTVMKHNKKVP